MNIELSEYLPNALLASSGVSSSVRASDEATGDMQYLSFTLNKGLYAVGILNVKEIIEYIEVTPVPMTPEFIKGVFNLRGSVLPVIDLSCRLGLGPSTLGKRSCIVTIELRASEEEVLDIGILVDAVNDVLTFDVDEMEAAPAFGSHIRSDFIQYIGKLRERFIVVLDIEKVLDLSEISIQERKHLTLKR